METKTEQTSDDVVLLKQALSEVDRYRSMDRLIPSPHNVVTIAAVEVCNKIHFWFSFFY
jgi:transcription initiation factor TFIID subunit 2